MKTKFLALLGVAFLIGIVAGAARSARAQAGQCAQPPCRLWDKTKAVAGVPGWSDRYPTDHSEPGSGTAPDGLTNSHPDNNPYHITCVNRYGHIAPPKCYTCDRWANGNCELACAGGLWCDDVMFGTCGAFGSCAM